MATSCAFGSSGHSQPFLCPPATSGLDYLLSKGYVTKAPGRTDGQYYLVSRAGACLTALGHVCKRVGSITSFARSLPSSDLTTFELFLTLQQQGWECSLSTAKSQCVPVQKNGDKLFHVHGNLLRPYFLVLLDCDTLLSKAEGFKTIHHLQCKAYYDAILIWASRSPEMLPLVFPDRPATYYKELMAGSMPNESRKRKGPNQRLSDGFGFEDEPGGLVQKHEYLIHLIT